MHRSSTILLSLALVACEPSSDTAAPVLYQNSIRPYIQCFQRLRGVRVKGHVRIAHRVSASCSSQVVLRVDSDRKCR
jgi:hypothetical protein